MISACFPNLRFLLFKLHKFAFAVPRDISFGYFLHLNSMNFNVTNSVHAEDENNDDVTIILREIQQTQAVIDDIGVSLPHLTELTLNMPTDRDVNFTSLTRLSKLETFCFTCDESLLNHPDDACWLTRQQVQDIRNMPALTCLDLYDGNLNAETIEMFANLPLKLFTVDFNNEFVHFNYNMENETAHQARRFHALRNIPSLTHIPDTTSFFNASNILTSDVAMWFFDAFPCIETFSCSMADASHIVPYFFKRTIPALKHLSLLHIDHMSASNWALVLPTIPNLTTLECTYTGHAEIHFLIEWLHRYRIPIESLTFVVSRDYDLAKLHASTFFGVYSIPTLSRLTFRIIGGTRNTYKHDMCGKFNTYQHDAIEQMYHRFQTQLEPDQVHMHAEKQWKNWDDEECVELEFYFKCVSHTETK